MSSSSSSIGTYLGCSNIDKTRHSLVDFNNIKLKLTQKLTGWKVRSLSNAGEVTFIKN